MEQSLFLEEVKKYFPGLAARVVTKLNDSKNPLSYLHKSMLKKEFSTNLKWESISVSGSAVAADVIALDSPIPLKKRDSLSRANGDVPKIAMEMALRERELTELDILAQTPGLTQELLAKLFRDTERVITGQYETLEYMFLLGLSSGVTVLADPDNVGIGVRIDYGYLSANKFGAEGFIWSNASSKPFDDLNRMKEKAKADGNIITKFKMDRSTFNNLAKNAQTKDLYAFSVNFAGSNTVIPTLSQVNTMAQDRYGFTIELVERSIVFEKNGVRTSKTPWQAGSVVGLTSDQVGRLVWGRLAEMNHPVQNVSYTTVDDFILVSKFRQNKPSLAEFTSSQGLILPVIDNVDSIYQLDTTQVQA
jgi:hypothetical protein